MGEICRYGLTLAVSRAAQAAYTTALTEFVTEPHALGVLALKGIRADGRVLV